MLEAKEGWPLICVHLQIFGKRIEHIDWAPPQENRPPGNPLMAMAAGTVASEDTAQNPVVAIYTLTSKRGLVPLLFPLHTLPPNDPLRHLLSTFAEKPFAVPPITTSQQSMSHSLRGDRSKQGHKNSNNTRSPVPICNFQGA